MQSVSRIVPARVRCLAGLWAAMLLLGLGAQSASAKTIEPYVFSHSFNGADTTAGAFTFPSYIGINHENGDIYVLDGGHGGVLDQFTENGVAKPFSDPSRAGASSIVIGDWLNALGQAGSGVAVDNSGTATQGTIFAMKGENGTASVARLFAFKPTGAILNNNWPICGSGVCGPSENWLSTPTAVATDSDGTPWVPSGPFLGTPPHSLNPFDPATGQRSLAKDQKILGQEYDNLLGTTCCTPSSTAKSPAHLIFDEDDNVYVVARSMVGCVGVCEPAVMKYSADGEVLNSALTPALPPPPTNNPAEWGVAADSSGNAFVSFSSRIEKFNASGERVDTFGTLTGAQGVTVNPNTDEVYIANTRGSKTVEVYEPGSPVVVPNVTTGPPTNVSGASATLTGTVDPDNGGDTTQCFFQWGKTTTSPQFGSADNSNNLTNTVTCNPATLTSGGGPQQVTANISSLNCAFPGLCGPGGFFQFENGNAVFYRLVTKNAVGPAQAGKLRSFRNGNQPKVGVPTVRRVNSDSAEVIVNVAPEGDITDYRVEWGPTIGYGDSIQRELPLKYATRPETAQNVTVYVPGLVPDTTYHYRVVVENVAGSAASADATFRTFTAPTFEGGCDNALSRQQTGAAVLRHCRSYEIVSASDQGGYDVESDLAPGQQPHAGYPDARDRLLYGIHDGGVPNSGEPTNRGVDPYIATRGDQGWTTRYIGIPVSAPSASPFASTLAGADSSLSAFAFGGPDICNPCFADESAGLPLRLPNGQLVQGMTGSIPVAKPVSAGTVAKPLSADGSHFVFGSTQKFEPDVTAGQLTIYDRNLESGTTSVVSKTPGGTNMTGASLAQLDISEDGSRILLGDQTGTDAKGNKYFHLYMNVGAVGQSIDLMPTAAAGARYDGMTADGTQVFFTTNDPLDSDGDTSADLYRADVTTSSSSLTRVSTGSESKGNGDICTPTGNWNVPSGTGKCDVLAIAGGGGVASEDGTAFFFSPEKLDGAANGTEGAPNLYISRPGADPKFVVTLETANPAVKRGIEAAGARNTADFQVNPTGDVSAFGTTLALKEGFENRGASEIYRYDADAAQLVCVSCPITNAPPAGGSSLATNGLSITDDGRVFFSSRDILVLSDANSKQDAYEWDDGVVGLISTGTNSNDSGLLSVSSDGKDAFFYTREKLAPQDENGPVLKIYDAREGGGFFVSPPPHPCKASDECHGAGTVPAPVPSVHSTQGEDGQLKKAPAKRCKKGTVKRKGKCVKKKKPRKTRKGDRR